MERNNRTPTIIFSYFKLHPTLDTNLELNAELLLLFSFTYDSSLPCFSAKEIVNVPCEGAVQQATCMVCAAGSSPTRLHVADVVTDASSLIARFKWSLLGGEIPPGQDKDLCYTHSDDKSARSEWILSPKVTEVFQPQLSVAVAQMCPFRGHWPRAGGFRRLLKGRLREMAKGKCKCEFVSI